MRALQTVLSPFMGRTFTGLGGYLGSNFAGSYLRERNQIANAQVATRLAPAISNDLIREVYKMPEVEIDAHNSSFFSQRIEQMTQNAIAYAESKVQFESAIVMSALSLLTTGFMTAPILAMLPAVGATSFLTARWLGKHERKVLRPSTDQFIDATNRAREKQDSVLKNIVASRSTGREEQAFERLNVAQSNKIQMGEKRKNVLLKCLKKVTGINVLLNLGIVGLSVASGMDIVGVAGTLAGTTLLTSGISSCVRSYYASKKLEDGLNDQYEKIKHKPIYDLIYGQEKAHACTNSIVLADICYHHRFRDDVPEKQGERLGYPIILTDKEFKINPGITVLGGMSGAGKTTLYKLLRHADDLSKGSISIGHTNEKGGFEGNKLTDLQKGEELTKIAFCLQDIENDGRTAVEIIKSGNPYLPDKNIEEVAERLNLKLYNQLPNGDKVPKTIGQLSGGEKKRVLFLQTLLTDKPILVFDEPTSGVDEAVAKEMISLLNEDNRTIIYTTHASSELTHLNAYQALDLMPMHDSAQVKTYREMYGNNVPLPSVIECHDFTKEGVREKYIELAKSRDTQAEQKREYAKNMISKMLAISAVIRAEQEKAKKATEEKKSASEQNQAETSKQKQKLPLLQRLFSKKARA